MTDVLNVPKNSVISSKNNGWHVDEYVSSVAYFVGYGDPSLWEVY